MEVNTSSTAYSKSHEKIRKVYTIQLLLIFTAFVAVPACLIFMESKLIPMLFSGAVVGGLVITSYYKKKHEDEVKEIFQSQNWEAINMGTNHHQSVEPKSEASSLKSRFGYLVDPNTVHAEIIVSEEVKNSINQGIAKIKHREFLYEKWNLKSIDKMDNKNIFNFFGLPGTGKTLSAIEVARSLNKKLFVADYAQIEDKHIGEAEKNISKVFELAKNNDAIIFLDEADALVSQRLEANTSQAQHLNAAKTVFMQELDQFNGIVILTTNLFQSFDPAILRRISQNIKFELPNEEMRFKIFKAHIPKEVNTHNLNYQELAEESKYLSGGDIKNVTREAMLKAITEADQDGDVTKACLYQKHLIDEINKVKETKLEYKNETKAKKIGI